MNMKMKKAKPSFPAMWVVQGYLTLHQLGQNLRVNELPAQSGKTAPWKQSHQTAGCAVDTSRRLPASDHSSWETFLPSPR